MSEKRSPQDEAKAYTLAHFTAIARRNQFAENGTIAHDTRRCLICRPELGKVPPFLTYLEVIRESVKERRPRLDNALVAAINSDLALMGDPRRVSFEALANAEPEAESVWRNWLRDAIDTGLGLLSVHSESSLEFSLEEAEEQGWGEQIEEAVNSLRAHQNHNRIAR